MVGDSGTRGQMVGGDCICKELISKPPGPSTWADGKFKGGKEGSPVIPDPVSPPSRTDSRISCAQSQAGGQEPWPPGRGAARLLREMASQPGLATPWHQMSNSSVGAARAQGRIRGTSCWGTPGVTWRKTCRRSPEKVRRDFQ